MNTEFKPQYVDIKLTPGGRMPGQGAPTKADKKEQHQIGIKSSVVRALGGKQAIQEIMQKAVQEAYDRLPK